MCVYPKASQDNLSFRQSDFRLALVACGLQMVCNGWFDGVVFFKMLISCFNC